MGDLQFATAASLLHQGLMRQVKNEKSYEDKTGKTVRLPRKADVLMRFSCAGHASQL
jgi:hypothetical protein